MFPFDNTYARRPAHFYARVAPTKVREPRLFYVNRPLAAELGIDAAELEADVLAGNVVPPGAEPLAQAYAGHQFGSFVPQLGDGRAILLGEVVGRDGRRRDVQLKGAGRTPFSRGGDGRAALGPVMREVIVSEAMAALGVPTTRALGAVTTGEEVLRDLPLPGAVLTRVAASHLRVGTFEYFAAKGDIDGLTALASYALERHYPRAGAGPDAADAADAAELLDRVIDAQASLVARWMGVGFVHGVMNTDNTTISGETIDYGPCAFLDEYDPNKRFSSIDRNGRYAFGRQARIAHWNMVRFAEALLPVIARSSGEADAIRVATERLERFVPRFDAAYARVLRAKLGLLREEAADLALGDELLGIMAADQTDFTLFFRRLGDAVNGPSGGEALLALVRDPAPLRAWLDAWRGRLAREDLAPATIAETMRQASPALVPRNHRVEEAIQAATEGDDYGPFRATMDALARPYEDPAPQHAWLATPPRPDERVERTFCGT